MNSELNADLPNHLGFAYFIYVFRLLLLTDLSENGGRPVEDRPLLKAAMIESSFKCESLT